MEQHLEEPPTQNSPSCSLFSPHDAEMGKAFSFGKQGDSKEGLSRNDQIVGVIEDEVVQPFRDDEDFVVLHVRTWTLVSMVLEVPQMARPIAIVVVDVESFAHETGSRLPNGRQFDSNVL